jgi:hypothetical protein
MCGAIVDFEWYYTIYKGTEADEVSFPALCARAEDIVGAMTRWRVDADNIGTYPDLIQTLYKKAICAQVDSFAVNGTESATASDNGRGWTVGKVSVSGKSSSDVTRKGALSGSISPMALDYLEQTGLMNPQVPTAHEPFMAPWGWL